jgi:hypothetical protein
MLFSAVVFLACCIFLSCSILDDYVVKKEDYDALHQNYTKTSEDLNNSELKLQQEVEKNRELNEIITENDEEINKYLDEISGQKKEIESLKDELSAKSIKNLEGVIEGLQKEPEKLRKLLDNINGLLKFVYTGSSANEEKGYTFTAFSIEHNGKYYIITAGHCISDNYGSDGLFKFKANFSDEWIQPVLIDYKPEFWILNDYAVFYGDDIYGGLKTGTLKTEENYLGGSLDKGLSVFRNLGDSSKKGESGSPVINEEMEVIGIYVKYGYEFSSIQLALDAIGASKINQ